MANTTRTRESYNVGIICALDIEKTAVEANLDEEHEGLPKVAGDDNSYTLGRIGKHNVAVACLPAGVMGKVSATAVAKDMMRSFPIKVGLMVGICGGVWSEQKDIRLGDVVVSQPDGIHGGVVQWDYGKMERDGVFRRTGTLNKPPRPLLNAVQSLKSKYRLKGSAIEQHLQDAFVRYPALKDEFNHQGESNDKLYESSYNHVGGNTCNRCDPSRVIKRLPLRRNKKTTVHYGNIASGDQVVKDASTRDRIAREEGIICFEMEAAGLMDSFPCIVIRGVCDYADSHKNKRWQPYAAMTAACYAKELLGVVNQNEVEELHTASFRVPFSLKGIPVVDHFVPRDDDMRLLETFFQACGKEERRRVFVVYGMGGIGKTQLCVEYARKCKTDFSAIFWLDGSSRDAVRQSLANVALELPSASRSSGSSSPHDAEDIDRAIESVLRWLSAPENRSWLLIMDNVDLDWQDSSHGEQAYDYKSFLPAADHGNVLITTRLSRLQIPQASLHLGTVSDQVALEMLETYSGRRLPAAKPLLEKLGGLPLALIQAGSYLRQTRISMEEYSKFYDKTWTTLMDTQDQFLLQEYAGRSVLTTWKISYRQVRMAKPKAADLLDMWAFMSPRDIWYGLAESNAEPATVNTPERLAFRHSVSLLSGYSLVVPDEDGQGFSIHPVVHKWCMHNITQLERRQQLSTKALRLVVAKIPQLVSSEYSRISRRLLPHARASTAQHLDMMSYQDHSKELEFIADFMQNWELSREVERLYLRAIDDKRKACGPEDLSTLPTVQSLAKLYWRKRDFRKAEELLLVVLRLREPSMNPNQGLNMLNRIGLVYLHQKKLQEAEKMFSRALRLVEETSGLYTPSVLATLHNLGGLYKEQGRLQEAEDFLIRALKGEEEHSGPNHPVTLDTVIGLGIVYIEQKRFEEAEEMLMRALKGMENVWGADHPSTLQVFINLGIAYYNQSRWQDAEEMYLRVLRKRSSAPGPDSWHFSLAAQNLSELYRYQGRQQEASDVNARASRHHKEVDEDQHEANISRLQSQLSRMGMKGS